MSSKKIAIVGSVYTSAGADGDFVWMLKQPNYHDALFVFNDNQEQYEAHRDDPTSVTGCAAGGGNAAIRPAQCENPPRAAGIPTGSAGAGYAALTPDVIATINEALAAIEKLLSSGKYSAVYYSSDGHGGLGTGIFNPGDDVKKHIVNGIESLAN